MSKPKAKPIPFQPEMVRAINEGHKTQTRRIMKPQPVLKNGVYRWKPRGMDINVEHINAAMSPYGKIGDLLWVKETWMSVLMADWAFIHYKSGDYEKPINIDQFDTVNTARGWRSPRFMPRWASRLTLEVVGIRVEQVQDISEADAKAEGCDGNCPVGHIPTYEAGPFSYHYAQLWVSINGSGSWDANPWVWVIEFKKVGVAHG